MTPEAKAKLFEDFQKDSIAEKCNTLKNLLAYGHQLEREYVSVREIIHTLDPDGELIMKGAPNASSSQTQTPAA